MVFSLFPLYLKQDIIVYQCSKSRTKCEPWSAWYQSRQWQQQLQIHILIISPLPFKSCSWQIPVLLEKQLKNLSHNSYLAQGRSDWETLPMSIWTVHEAQESYIGWQLECECIHIVQSVKASRIAWPSKHNTNTCRHASRFSQKAREPISQIAERIKPCSYSKKLNQCNKIIPQVYYHSRCTGSQSNHNRSIVGGFKLRMQCIDFGLLALEVDFWRESISHRALLCISNTKLYRLGN